MIGVRRCCSSSSFDRHKMRQSYISRTVWRRITEFYVNINTGQLYNQTQQDITSYFQSESVDVPKMAENDACEGFNLESLNLTNVSICRRCEQPCRIWRHWLLPVGCSRSLKSGRKCCLRQLLMEFLQNGLSDDHEIYAVITNKRPVNSWNTNSCFRSAAKCN